MSNKAIRAILETALVAITPSFPTAFVGDDFEPEEGVPFQEVFFNFADPDNALVHRAYIQEGYMQVNLYYPLLQGTGASTTRAEVIQSAFKSGAKFSGVTISSTPAIREPRVEDDRMVQSVIVNFSMKIQEA